MAQILTLTLNPCIDKSLSVPALISEKKMYCSRPRYEPGGGGINVARAIYHLKGEALAVFLAGGYNGLLLEELLKAEKVPVKPVPIRNSTRENTIVLDESANLQYRFNIPGPEIYQIEWLQCLATVSELIRNRQFIVFSGSLPAGIPSSFFEAFERVAKNKNARLVVDTSGDALLQASRERTFMLKPSIRELAALTGISGLNNESSTADVVSAASRLMSAGLCDLLVVSMGERGAIWLQGDKQEEVIAPKVKIKSTVGAGDCLVAGIVRQLSQGKSTDESVRYGVACGTAATMNPGTGLCQLADVEILYAQMQMMGIRS
jgi:6-phosphofructokinase 2